MPSSVPYNGKVFSVQKISPPSLPGLYDDGGGGVVVKAQFKAPTGHDIFTFFATVLSASLHQLCHIKVNLENM